MNIAKSYWNRKIMPGICNEKAFLLYFFVITFIFSFAMEDEKIEKYLKQGADVNYKKEFSKTALIEAVKNLNKDLFDFLLQHNADINSCDITGRTSLYYFIERKHRYESQPNIKQLDIEKDFLKRGADPNIKVEGNTLFHNAVKFRAIDFMRLLIKYGAKINEKDIFAWTPLRWAIEYNYFKEIEELCSMGVSLNNLDYNNSNAFHAAIKRKLPKNYINLLITKHTL